MARKRSSVTGRAANAESYSHPESKVSLRPDVGTQPQFKKKKPPQRYRYDSSLAPSLEWDDQNPAREQGEQAIAELLERAADAERAGRDARQQAAEALKVAKNELLERPGLEAILASAAQAETAATAMRAAAEKLRALGRPFLNWAGKAERMSFDVPTLPLFVHERLSTKAIIETLSGHRRSQETQLALFGDPEHSITDQVLKAYEYQDQWVNRMILGDSLVVMNSLLRYESLGGQVQMIYMDPPYGIKYGSNFQPFVRRRDVKHNDDEDMTREPEMVQAYRDTWRFGVHSYLTCLRDRLLLCRELLASSGSIFVQISDENLHHVREVVDEVFGSDNFMNIISFRVKSPLGVKYLGRSSDFIIWYAKDRSNIKYRQCYVPKLLEEQPEFNMVELPDGIRMTLSECRRVHGQVPEGSRYFTAQNLASSGYTESCMYDVKVNGKVYSPPRGKSWKTHRDGMTVLVEKRRVHALPNSLRFVYYLDDFPVQELSNMWTDTFAEGDKQYVVQTSDVAIRRCMMMTTDPGDLVLDPTCGSGTTAYVAEQWGRRWITCDASRVPIALARQRLLTATFSWYKLKDDQRGPAAGFVYERKQNTRGEEIGGIVPHITLKSIANHEPPSEEVLADRPEAASRVTRVCGHFTVEATIPTPVDLNGDGQDDSRVNLDDRKSFNDRMLEVLRRSPLLRLDGKKTVNLMNVRLPAKTLSLSAEAIVINGTDQAVAFVFGPENGAVSEKLVYQAAREATAKSYSHLYVVGFAIQPNARALVDQCEQAMGIQATNVQATPDLLMGDLLKNMRSSQIFSVCGLPEVKVRRAKGKERNRGSRYEVELVGLDVFDPVTMQTEHRGGDDVPAWFLDTDYNELCFHVSQAFFPRTSAWENLKRALKGDYDEGVWEHLAGTVSAPFEAGEHGRIAVKVIDDRGNELMIVKPLS